MLSISKNAFIYFCALPVDLRKGCEGLAAISCSLVEQLPKDAYFIFINRKRNRIKVLHWDTTNLSYLFLRSRQGVFAPKDAMSSVITQTDFMMILRGHFPNYLSLKNREIS